MTGRRGKPASRPLSAFTIVATAGAALAVFVAFIWVAVVSPRGVPGLSYRYLDAQFRDAANVGISTEVRIHGRNVGQVTRAQLRDGISTLRLQLRSGTAPVRSDARARIRLKSVLGGKYVELDPGRSPDVLRDGATLPAGRTSTAADLLDVVGALDAPHRRELRAVLNGLGAGLAGRGGDVNDMLGSAAPVLGDTRRVADSVLARDGAAARLIPSAESAAAAFDPVREELAGGLRPEAAVLDTLAGRRADIERTLDVAPSSLAALRGGLTAATPLLDETAGLARAAVRLTGPAPVALRETAALLAEARPALRSTEPLLRTLQDAVPPAVRLLERLDPVIDPARRALTEGLPPLVELGSRPCDLASFAGNWRSMMGYGIAPGSGDPTGDLDDDAGLGAINSVRLILASPPPPDMLSFDATPGQPAANAYPAPCEAERERLR